MWRRTQPQYPIAMVATAAMLLLANSSSYAATVVLRGGGNVTYGGGGGFTVMTEEMELEMLIEDLYFSVHVSRVLQTATNSGTGTGGTTNSNRNACPTNTNGIAICDPAATGNNNGRRSTYDRTPDPTE